MDDRSRARLEGLRDDRLPPIAAMLESGGDLWTAMRHGGAGEAAEVRAVQLNWQPGRLLSVRYEARDPEGDAAGTAFFAHAARQLPDGAAVLTGDLGSVAAWELAGDPWLPGLQQALDPAAVRELLASLDVPRAPVALRLRAYRPGRRAVVEVRTGAHRFFLKVVRPSRIEALQARHRVLEDTLPVPRSHGWSESYGLVVLEAMPGKTLREVLASGEPAPSVLAVSELMRAIGPIGDGRPVRSQVAAGIAHLDLVRRLAPKAARAIEGYDIPSMAGESRAELTVHGDLHEAQLLIEAGEVSGLLDIDTVGLGDPRDDWATFLAHLLVRRAEATGPERERLEGYAREVAAVLFDLAPPGAPSGIDARVAAVILGLAAGPFAVLAPNWADLVDGRVALAASWLRGEGRDALSPGGRSGTDAADEDNLISRSSQAHPGTAI